MWVIQNTSKSFSVRVLVVVVVLNEILRGHSLELEPELDRDQPEKELCGWV